VLRHIPWLIIASASATIAVLFEAYPMAAFLWMAGTAVACAYYRSRRRKLAELETAPATTGWLHKILLGFAVLLGVVGGFLAIIEGAWLATEIVWNISFLVMMIANISLLRRCRRALQKKLADTGK